ncbi:diguanylate cyclase [Roseimaritima ulvae]|uniref:diguanylate cyclase n=1 Tax=Roseimaritima ulvae TaxID=980254 RepID=A0A5B9QX11_9BACT|nr:diguanylate cyclase [Roseimaritima ulvae]QEG41656.1 Diguanylate cyclase YdeH [Roseimaritima ulvae]
MLEFIFALVCGLGGLLAGYFLRGSLSQENETPAVDPAGEETTSEDALDRNTVNQVAEQLQRLTARVAADVDEHHTQVQRASNVLCDSDVPPTAESIVATVADLITANQHMQAKLEQAQERIHEQSEQIQTAEARALTDSLTKVWNRRALDEQLQECHAKIGEQACSLMLVDVDHFKKFNDTYGHVAGDHVLTRVAVMLRARLADFAFVARYGGEEFAVLFAGRDINACRHQAELSRRAIGEREIIFEDRSLRVKMSAGLAELQAGESVQDWLKRADAALYTSKQSGRNCGHWMDGDTPRPLRDAQLNKTTALPALPAETSSGPAGQTLRVEAASGEQSLEAEAVGDAMTAPATADKTLAGEPQLREHFGRLVDRLSKVSVELFVLVIRCDQARPATATDASILKVIRATTRSLDYIGQTSNQDLVVCMPSANENSAVERAQRIRSGVEQSPAVAGVGPLTVSIGIACVSAEDDFDSVLSLATAAAEDVQQAGGNQLAVRRPQLIS